MFLTKDSTESVLALGELYSGEIRIRLRVSSSKEPPERSNNYKSFRMRLGKSSSSVLLPLVPRMWAAFFFKAATGLGHKA